MCYRPAPNRTAEAAFDIAWQFLQGRAVEPAPVQTFLADNIGRQFAEGVRSPLKLANIAIAAFEARK